MTNYDVLLEKVRALGMDYRWSQMFVKKLRDDEAAFPVDEQTKKRDDKIVIGLMIAACALCLGILGVPTPWCSQVRLLPEWFSSDASPVGVVLLGVLALGCFALKALAYCSQEWLLAVCVAPRV